MYRLHNGAGNVCDLPYGQGGWQGAIPPSVSYLTVRFTGTVRMGVPSA